MPKESKSCCFINTLSNEHFQGVIVADDDNASLDESAANRLLVKIDLAEFAEKIATSKLGRVKHLLSVLLIL